MHYPSFVEETTTTTGTGNLTLAGATAGHRTFAAAVTAGHLTINEACPYYLFESSGLWERGIGWWTNLSTFQRDTVLENSLGTTANVSLTGGGATIRCSTMPPMLMNWRACSLYNGTTYSLADGLSDQIEWDYESTDTDGVWCDGMGCDATKILIPNWVSMFQVQAWINLTEAGTFTEAGWLRMSIIVSGAYHVGPSTEITPKESSTPGTYKIKGSVHSSIMRCNVDTSGYIQLQLENKTGDQIDIPAYDLFLSAQWLG